MSQLILLTGGGTGGHIYPNLALIGELEKRGFLTAYAGGSGDTLERRLAEDFGVPYYGFDVIKLIRGFSPHALLNNLRIPAVLVSSVKEAKATLKKLSPDLVFSKGGYAALPAVLAASELGIPVMAHESDHTLGLANKIAAKRGAIILKADPYAQFDGITVGMPLRHELFDITQVEARRRLGLSPYSSRKVLLILGGSLGARAINESAEKILPKLLERFDVLHIYGKSGKMLPPQDHLKQFAYADDMAAMYAASDIVLSRAGATAVFEIAALKKRAVFVPLPKGTSRGDQIYNAELAQRYGGIGVCQNESLADNILPALDKALQNPPMTPILPDANRKIANLVYDTLRRGVKCKDKKL